MTRCASDPPNLHSPSQAPWRRPLAWALILAGLCYSSWLLELVLATGLDPVTSFLSEHDGIGRPFRAVFRSADEASGGLAVIAGVLGSLRLRPRTAFAAIAAFGVATIADALAPVDCIPTPTDPCGPGASGLFPQLYSLHAATSAIAVNAVFVAMLTCTAAAWRRDRHGAAARWMAAAVAVCTVSTAWMLVADNVSGDWALGIAQRVQVGAMSAWLVIAGVLIRRRSPAFASRR